MKQRSFFICIILCILLSASCSINAVNKPCDEQADDLVKGYKAIVQKSSSSPKRVFKQFNELKEKAEEALETCPDNISLYHILSSAYVNLGRNKDALTVSQKALSINPESAEANSLVGGALSFMDRSSEALPYLEKAVKLNSNDLDYQINLCSTYDMAKQYDKAIDSCSKLIEKKDEKVLGTALYIRARAYHAMGKKQEATEDFEQAKALGVDLGEYYTPDHLGESHK